MNASSSCTVTDLAQACVKLLPEFEKEYDAYIRMAKRTGVWPYKPGRILFIERLLASANLIEALATNWGAQVAA